jgi:hypothetical protein
MSNDERRRLQNRRDSELFNFQALGLEFTASISRYPTGEIGEIFIDPAKPGSAINTLVHDMAIAFSFAVQHGADAADILRALDCDEEGRPLSPLGVAIDAFQRHPLSATALVAGAPIFTAPVLDCDRRVLSFDTFRNMPLSSKTEDVRL